MENTTAALTAAQALHAGTIQERLTVAQDQSEEEPVTEKKNNPIQVFGKDFSEKRKTIAITD